MPSARGDISTWINLSLDIMTFGEGWNQACKQRELPYPAHITPSLESCSQVQILPWTFREIKTADVHSTYWGLLRSSCLSLSMYFKPCLYNPKISDLIFFKSIILISEIQSYGQASKFIKIGLSLEISKQNKSGYMVHSFNM